MSVTSHSLSASAPTEFQSSTCAAHSIFSSMSMALASRIVQTQSRKRSHGGGTYGCFFAASTSVLPPISASPSSCQNMSESSGASAEASISLSRSSINDAHAFTTMACFLASFVDWRWNRASEDVTSAYMRASPSMTAFCAATWCASASLGLPRKNSTLASLVSARDSSKLDLFASSATMLSGNAAPFGPCDRANATAFHSNLSASLYASPTNSSFPCCLAWFAAPWSVCAALHRCMTLLSLPVPDRLASEAALRLLSSDCRICSSETLEHATARPLRSPDSDWSSSVSICCAPKTRRAASSHDMRH
mmetsp:Transcript_610/g.1268  ORF Transcript_610/g.1268 Transcript_610/m.1268 type:complete len:307 (-) Transcript_610:67-987(-)